MLEPSLGLTAEEARIANDLRHKGFAVFDFPDVDLDARIDRMQHNLGPRYGIDFANPQSDKTIAERRIQDAWKFDNDVARSDLGTLVVDLDVGVFTGFHLRVRG